MILTRTRLNARRDGARKLLGSPHAMHAAVLSGFPPDTDPGRVLWRLDEGRSPSPVLYVVSRATPDFTHIDEQAGWPSRSMAESVQYDKFLGGLMTGQEWAFRVTVNPTHRVKQGNDSVVMGHVTVEQQTQWLVERASAIGVEWTNAGDSETPSVALVDRAVRTFKRGEGRVTLSTATFSGGFRVVDPDALRSALTTGLGRAKAYGCGLMTLAKP